MAEPKAPESWWRVDLHTHTSFSADSLNEPGALVARARRVGLNRIAVTDHNTIQGALAAKRLAPDLIIVGEEIETATGGELIAYYVEEEVPANLSLEETLRQLHEQGAVISISHPLDRLRGSALGLQRALEIMEEVDALEVFNARCLLSSDNERSAALAAQHGKRITAGSDGHMLREIGAGYLLLPPFEDTPDAFRASLVQAKAGGRLSGVWPHFGSTYAKWARRRKSGE